MNFKSISILLTFTFVSLSVLCHADLDYSDERFDIYEELENLTKTNDERGTSIVVSISAIYICDAGSPFTQIISATTIAIPPPIGTTAAAPFTVTRKGLKCTSLTIGKELGIYAGIARTAPNVNLDFTNARTVILRVNGNENLKQSGTFSTGACTGAKFVLRDTITPNAITQNQNVALCRSTGIVTQTTTTAVFTIEKICPSTCTGIITYTYTPTTLKKQDNEHITS